jgi:IS30 family transposase
MFRPDDAAHRRQFGHRIGDLMLFEQKRSLTNVTSLVERVSRFTVTKKTQQTHQASDRKDHPLPISVVRSDTPRVKSVKDLPYQARRSTTFDRESE